MKRITLALITSILLFSFSYSQEKTFITEFFLDFTGPSQKTINLDSGNYIFEVSGTFCLGSCWNGDTRDVRYYFNDPQQSGIILVDDHNAFTINEYCPQDTTGCALLSPIETSYQEDHTYSYNVSFDESGDQTIYGVADECCWWDNQGGLTFKVYSVVTVEDILLNGTVSAENHQIKNVADPTDAQDAVTLSLLQSKIDELIQRIEDLENNTSNAIPVGTWKKILSPENLPQNFDLNSIQAVKQYSYNKNTQEVYFLNKTNNLLFIYDVNENSFIEKNVTYQIPSHGAHIYNPAKNTIEYLRAGRETVYEVNLETYESTLVKSESSDAHHYGASMFYNPFTSEIGQIFGYGFYSVKNSLANLSLENGWVIDIPNSTNSPQKRTGASVFPTKDYKKLIVLAGHGNQSGSQTESSCSNSNTTPWASDVGVWCFQSDIWEIDLSNNNVTQLSDFDVEMKKAGIMGFNYDKNILINYAGILPPATYSSNYSENIDNWDFSLLFFDINNVDEGWQLQEQTGDIPSNTTDKGYFIYDENTALFYYFRNDGIWSLKM